MVLKIRQMSPKKPVVVSVGFFDDNVGTLGVLTVYHAEKNSPQRKYKRLRRWELKVELRHGMTQKDILKAVKREMANNRWYQI